MESTKSILEDIRKRPIIYLGEKSLYAFRHFWGGYSAALMDHGIQDSTECLIPSDFHDWVAYRLHFREATSGWYRMIRHHSQNEAEAFDRFYQLLDEYHTREEHIVAKYEFSFSIDGVSSDGTIAETDETRSPLLIVTYTQDPGFFVQSAPEKYKHLAMFYPQIEWFEFLSGADRTDLTIIDPNWNYGLNGGLE
jgi:hypothetical protein